jgi:hypothetical protein
MVTIVLVRAAAGFLELYNIGWVPICNCTDPRKHFCSVLGKSGGHEEFRKPSVQGHGKGSEVMPQEKLLHAM